MKNRIIDKYWIKYTVIATIIILIVYGWIWPGQISFSLTGDNYRQHYYALMNIGKWYREIFYNIFRNHSFQIPFYDYNLQYGAGILETYSYYGLYDPLNILSAFVPAKYTEYLFWFLMVFRTFLMGITFSIFARSKGMKDSSVLMGSIIYITCGFNLGPCISQIIFQPAMVMLPLLFWGASIILEKNEKPYKYIISTWLFISCSFYFYYMAAIALIAYCVTWCLVKRKSIKGILIYIWKFFYSSIIGIGIGAVYLLPEILTIFGNNRMNVHYEIPILYELKYYISLIGRLFNTGSIYSEYLGFSAIAIVLLIFLFFRKNKNEEEKIVLYLCIIGFASLLIPWIAHFLNGMSYVGNRWTYLLTLPVSYGAILVIESLEKLSQVDILKCFIVWFLVSLGVIIIEENRGLVTYCSIFVGTLYLLYLLVHINMKDEFEGTFIRKIFGHNVVALVLIFLCVFNLSSIMYKSYNNRIKLGTAYSKAVEENIAKKIDDKEGFYRIDYSNDALISYNQSLMAEEKGIEYYWSTASGVIQTFLAKLGVSTYYGMMSRGVDGRTFLDNYLGVRYYIKKEDEEVRNPYSYDKFIKEVTVDNGTYEIYTQEGVETGLVRFYNQSISTELFDDMNHIERQEALLRYAIMPNGFSLNERSTGLSSKEISYEIEQNENILITDDLYIVKKDGVYLDLHLDQSVENAELYVDLKGIDYKPYNPYKNPYKELEGYTFAEKWTNFCKFLNWIPSDIAEIQCGYEETWRTIKYPTNRNPYGYGRDSFACNMGYIDDGSDDTIQLYFPCAGEYTIHNIEILEQPVENVEQICNEMYSKVHVQNLEINNNDISIQFFTDSFGILQIALPYAKGWRAIVDGEPVQIYEDVLFMDIVLDRGMHDIELIYIPYGMKMGGIITISSVTCFIVLVFLHARMKKRKVERKNNENA